MSHSKKEGEARQCAEKGLRDHMGPVLPGSAQQTGGQQRLGAHAEGIVAPRADLEDQMHLR